MTLCLDGLTDVLWDEEALLWFLIIPNLLWRTLQDSGGGEMKWFAEHNMISKITSF